jgi:two-component system, OmpR family, sensor histidine kinase KdpD
LVEMFRAIRPPSRSVFGTLCALGLLVALSLVMLTVRSHLDIATVGLVLVVPVVVGAVIGGFSAGGVAVVGGFFAYDLLFIKPYYTFAVGGAENWVPLVVFVVVMALTARATSHLWVAEADARRRELEAERLFELSELIMEDRTLADLLRIIVATVKEAFDVEAVVLLLPTDRGLEIVARAGRVLSDDELRQITPSPGVPSSLIPAPGAGSGERSSVFRTLALSSADRPIGLLGLVGLKMEPDAERLLATFGHHLAISLERAQLREQAVRIGVLEEVDQLRRSLVGAVSHDLRTPLATIKTAASALRNSGSNGAPTSGLAASSLAPSGVHEGGAPSWAPVSGAIGAAERDELLLLIEGQTDRLTRLVANLLDMSRIQSRSLVVRSQTIGVPTYVEEAIDALGPDALGRVTSDVEEGLPPVSVDQVLMTEVLVNLLENALRYTPDGSLVHVTAFAGRTELTRRSVVVCVSDNGPGISPADRPHIFERARRAGSEGNGEMSGGAGIGLSIAKAFTEAHGSSIWLESPPHGGARFCFSMPIAAEPSKEAPEAVKRSVPRAPVLSPVTEAQAAAAVQELG